MRWGRESVTKDETVLAWYIDFLQRQMILLNSLIEVESHSKWALVALVETMQRYFTVGEKQDQTEAESHRAKVKDILELLCEIDPKHVNRYRYLDANSGV